MRIIELDFQEVWGIDMREPGFFTSRSFHWFRLRVIGLLSTESRLQRVLLPQKAPTHPK